MGPPLRAAAALGVMCGTFVCGFGVAGVPLPNTRDLIGFSCGRAGAALRLRGAGRGGGGEVERRARTLVLFDIDGTLTAPRQPVEGRVLEALEQLRSRATIGFVGGSDLRKAREQLGEDCFQRFDYCFPENGLQAYRNGYPREEPGAKCGSLIGSQDLAAHLGEDRLQRLLNWTLRYVAGLELPVKRGTFIEFRTGMLNISPIGRNCSPEQRDAFEQYDKVGLSDLSIFTSGGRSGMMRVICDRSVDQKQEHCIRQRMIDAMRAEFAEFDLSFSVGGQISFDVFPRGWDKTFSLRYVEDLFQEIHFFGDKTEKGGNDHEIFEDARTIGHAVGGPDDTLALVHKLFLSPREDDCDNDAKNAV